VVLPHASWTQLPFMYKFYIQFVYSEGHIFCTCRQTQGWWWNKLFQAFRWQSSAGIQASSDGAPTPTFLIYDKWWTVAPTLQVHSKGWICAGISIRTNLELTRSCWIRNTNVYNTRPVHFKIYMEEHQIHDIGGYSGPMSTNTPDSTSGLRFGNRGEHIICLREMWD